MINIVDIATKLRSVFGFVTAERSVTGGIGFNGVIVDMDETPDDDNTAALAVGTLIISPAD